MKAERMRIFVAIVTLSAVFLLPKGITLAQDATSPAPRKLTDTEAEKFWPVYEQYISELVKINGTKCVLIKQYLQSGGSLTDAEAESTVKQWVDIDQSVAGFRMKYIPTFRKVLSPKNTALFYQLDRRVQLMIDFRLASSLPLIEQ